MGSTLKTAKTFYHSEGLKKYENRKTVVVHRGFTVIIIFSFGLPCLLLFPILPCWSFREKFSIRVSMSNFKSRKYTVQGKPVNPGCNSEGGLNRDGEII